MSEKDVKSMVVAELKDKLKELKLPVSGSRAVLVERLEAALSKTTTTTTSDDKGETTTVVKTSVKRKASASASTAAPASPSGKRLKVVTATATTTTVEESSQVVKEPTSPKTPATKTPALTEEAILAGTVPFVRLTKDSDFDPTKHCKIISWNVNGLNALMKNGSFLQDMVDKQQPDALCLQETKIQAKDVEVAPLKGYKMYNSVSVDKLGYSGTRVYVKECLDVKSVHYGLLKGTLTSEGRAITIEFPDFYLVNTYVPNAGEKLERLEYRIKTWDAAMLAYLKDLQTRKPVVWTGDLNVAERDYDRYFAGTYKQMEKNAGFTPQERASFRQMTSSEHGLVDTFRLLYPKASKIYSFWGYRTNARPVNNGWRLDYFVCSEPLAKRAVDCFMLGDVMGSDHCPVVLWLPK